MTPFQQYLRGHPDFRAENGLRVFRLYDNYEMSESDAKLTLLKETQEYVEQHGSSEEIDKLLASLRDLSDVRTEAGDSQEKLDKINREVDEANEAAKRPMSQRLR